MHVQHDRVELENGGVMLTRSIWNAEQYDYLSLEDSRLYDQVKDSDDPKDQAIKRLILDKAMASRADHVASKY